MTSREGSERGFWDPLGAMISWALREDVADATPPSRVWREVSERLQQRSGRRRRMVWRQGFRVAYRSAALWLLDVAVGPPTELVYFDNPGLGRVREKYHLCLLMYQNDLPMLSGEAV